MKNLLKVLLLAIVLALGLGEASGQFAWTKDSRNPVFSGGTSGAWNRHVFMPCVLYNTDSSRYEMWFGASSGSPWHPYSVGFASSKDGINWTMYPSAVLSPTPGTWDALTVEEAVVIRESGQYKMWYSSWLGVAPKTLDYLGYATSPDGIHWTKYSGNPIFGPGTAAWEGHGPYTCSVMPFPGGYQMWYGALDTSGTIFSIGYATSSDGISWQRDTVNNPVLKPGTVGQWDYPAVIGPQILQTAGTYYMWYLGASSDWSSKHVGCATSKDSGKTWTKYSGNPVLSPSAGWDGSYVEPGAVLLRGDTLHMWYSGGLEPIGSNPWRIGHATSALTVIGITERQQEVPQQFMLCQNYPNPFNPTTVVRYQLPVVSDVKLVVYDLLGREVSVLVNEKNDVGVHEVSFDAAGLPSGVYVYRIQAGDFVQAKKLIVVK